MMISAFGIDHGYINKSDEPIRDPDSGIYYHGKYAHYVSESHWKQHELKSGHMIHTDEQHYRVRAFHRDDIAHKGAYKGLPRSNAYPLGEMSHVSELSEHHIGEPKEIITRGKENPALVSSMRAVLRHHLRLK